MKVFSIDIEGIYGEQQQGCGESGSGESDTTKISQDIGWYVRAGSAKDVRKSVQKPNPL
jgi:hypothetical protein